MSRNGLTAEEFRAAIEAAGLPDEYAAAKVIGVTRMTGWRYAKDGAPEPVMRLLEMFRRHGVPPEFL